MKKYFYITTTLPYVNADPHIGFAMEIVRADIIARSKKLAGYEVFFNTGTDEHGLKIYQKAFGLSETPQQFVDRYVEKFKNLKDILGLSQDINFTRTTDSHHIQSAQKFWLICKERGYIYKKLYKSRYCSGCELERTDVEIENERCFLHQNIDLVIIEEENYFFKFQLFQDKLLEYYKKHLDFVIPTSRFNEISSFVKRGLEDFSISRLVSKMPWGISVPDDPDHVMYVWFDALVNYISAIGWPDRPHDFEKWWIKSGGVVQYCGKDNIRQQVAMWQAMLMAVGLPQSKTIVIDGFVTGEGGLKMSKTLGNTVDPVDVVKEYGTDSLRYYISRELHPFEDSSFTLEGFKESYNAHLANGLGNLVSRVLKMAETNDVWVELPNNPVDFVKLDQGLVGFEINKFCDVIWERIEKADKYIDNTKPFKTIKENKTKGENDIKYLLNELWVIAHMLTAVLPQTSETIKQLLKDKKTPAQPLFVRK